MAASHNKHELDIPMLNPNGYMDEFFHLRKVAVGGSFQDFDQQQITDLLKAQQTDQPGNTLWLKPHLADHLLGALPTDQAQELLNKVQLKMALFGRLFTAYNDQWRKASEIHDDSDVYGLAALCFFNAYEQHQDFNALNTGIKLCDKIVVLGSLSPLATLAMTRENELLTHLNNG